MMNFKVKYNTIAWSVKAKREAHETIVSAKDANEAVGKIIKKTKGHGINFRVEEIKDEVLQDNKPS